MSFAAAAPTRAPASQQLHPLRSHWPAQPAAAGPLCSACARPWLRGGTAPCTAQARAASEKLQIHLSPEEHALQYGWGAANRSWWGQLLRACRVDNTLARARSRRSISPARHGKDILARGRLHLAYSTGIALHNMGWSQWSTVLQCVHTAQSRRGEVWRPWGCWQHVRFLRQGGLHVWQGLL